MTEKEKVMQELLRRNGYSFISQRIIEKKIGFYILDFYIKSPFKLCIEVDGWHHLTKRINYDIKRTLYLELEKDIEVIRFRNDEVVDTPKFESFLLSEIEKHRKVHNCCFEVFKEFKSVVRSCSLCA